MTNDGEVRFDGHVAIVTGSGRGMGREHAMLLARRGAKVVISDVVKDNAEQTVQDIVSAGGVAISFVGNISERAVANQMVKVTLDTFGRVDIIVNNAGIARIKPFEETTDEDLEEILGVHLKAAWYLTQAAWPSMAKQKYGRVVMIISAAVLGLNSNTAYGAAKAAMWGLARSLSVEGKPHNINVNSFGQAGLTQMVTDNLGDENTLKWMSHALPAAAVAPVLAWLVHEDCNITGDTITAGGRAFTRWFMGETRGYSDANADWTPEVIRAHWAEGCDDKDYHVPKKCDDSVMHLSKMLSGAMTEESWQSAFSR
ncbi:hypothetical protein BKA56DRAFT_596905 [Ilyonectria sp. MPI-CAGE-AT-0026]|nr:hypothetical protein BKA56DRAFT_596905 [Ilyonectria sp. MPI-CAGE-AT-0026]